MSDYTPVNDYSAKDALSSGDPNKLIKGSDIDLETAALQTAIATKYDSSDLGVTLQAWDADLDAIAALAKTDGNFIVGNGTTWVAESGATARTSLGLVIGTDVQAYSANLAAIAALAVTDGNVIVGNGSAWVAESGATARTSLGLTIGTDVQAFAATLAAISALAVTDGNIIVGNGATWVAESGATARASLGVNTASTSAEGLVEIATSAETYTGTDTARAVTADGIADTIFSLHIDVPDGGPATITKASPGASGWSVSRTAEGTITVTHNLGLTSANDMIVVVCPGERSAGNAISAAVDSLGTNSFVVSTINASAIDSDSDVLLICHRVA